MAWVAINQIGKRKLKLEAFSEVINVWLVATVTSWLARNMLYPFVKQILLSSFVFQL